MPRDTVEMELQLPRDQHQQLAALAEECGVPIGMTAEALLVAGLLDQGTEGRRQFVRTYKMLQDVAQFRPQVQRAGWPGSQQKSQQKSLRDSLRDILPDGLPADLREHLLDAMTAGLPAGARLVKVEICRERNGGGN